MARKYLGGYMQQKFGFTTTWENADGKTLTVHRVGRIREQLVGVIDVVLKLDPSFRLVCYSTPDTILTDIEGRQLRRERDGRPIAGPESIVVGAVKRMDLLHPRFDRRDRKVERW